MTPQPAAHRADGGMLSAAVCEAPDPVGQWSRRGGKTPTARGPALLSGAARTGGGRKLAAHTA